MNNIEKNILTLLLLPGFGRKSVYKFLWTYQNLIENNGSKEILSAIHTFAETNKRIKPVDEIGYNNASFKAEQILLKQEEEGIMPVTINSEFYPKNFYDLGEDAPVLFFAKGNLELLKENKFITVIGTRNISEYAAKVGTRLSQVLAENNEIIVSGLALGSDSCGHNGAMKATDGKTIAILPSPIDKIVPSQNKELSQRIIDNNSLLISEYWTGTASTRGSFIDRDRLQAGLSNGIAVLETDINGGTFHAVNKGMELNRILGCLPNNMVKLPGNQLLLDKYSAMSLSNSDDINTFIKDCDKYVERKSSEQKHQKNVMYKQESLF